MYLKTNQRDTENQHQENPQGRIGAPDNDGWIYLTPGIALLQMRYF